MERLSVCSYSVCGDLDSQKPTSITEEASSESTTSRRIVESLCIVGNPDLADQLQHSVQSTFGIPVESQASIETQNSTLQKSIAFVLGDFGSVTFNYLYAVGHRIYGPTVILECVETKQSFPLKSRPLYCQTMKDVVVCLSGFKDKHQISHLVALVHHMGGSVRKDFTSSCTHVISNTTQKERYRLAVGMGRPVMSENWILKSWERRNVLFASALAEDLMILKLKPFHDLRLMFSGFSKPEGVHMEELTKQNGGTISEEATNSTHIVVDVNSLPKDVPGGLPFEITDGVHVVTAEWFWLSIQLNVCANEKMYPALEQSSKRPNNNAQNRSPMINGHHQQSKPKRSSIFNRRCSTSNGLDNRLSTGSFFDVSGDTSSILADNLFSTDDVENIAKTQKRCMSKRQQTCIELLQTENNYFQVLRTIVKVFKEPLEQPDTIGGEILDSTELKLIFGHVPPIFELHNKINNDLTNLIMHWDEMRCIGSIWLNYKEELLKFYPPFVNFFEKTKETLNYCDRTNPRFHAFLKVCQSKPECQRQTLQELLIRPVQRLPSVILLLNDLLKRTEKANPDYQYLLRAIDTLKGVLTHINDDKRKTEGQVKLFDIINDVKNCPPYLLSSQRILVASAEVTELSNGLTRKGTNLTFFVFNDCLEIAEKRLPSMRPDSQSKKHVELLFLSHIRRVVNIKGADSENLFCLTIRDDFLGDKNYPFQLTNFTTKEAKRTFLTSICTQVVAVTGRVDFDVYDYDVSSKHNESDLSKTIVKAVKRAKSLSRKLSRNISKSSSLQRAVSHMAMAWSGTLSRMSMSRTNLRLHSEDGAISNATSLQQQNLNYRYSTVSMRLPALFHQNGGDPQT